MVKGMLKYGKLETDMKSCLSSCCPNLNFTLKWGQQIVILTFCLNLK